MTATTDRKTRSRREGWGSLRKLSSGRWQARYPGPDGQTYTARTEDDKPLTFLTKTDARTWLANVHTQIARGQWEPPAVVAARRRADAEAERVQILGFAEYAEHWMEKIRTQPNRSGKRRSEGTFRSYQGKVSGSPGALRRAVRDLHDDLAEGAVHPTGPTARIEMLQQRHCDSA